MCKESRTHWPQAVRCLSSLRTHCSWTALLTPRYEGDLVAVNLARLCQSLNSVNQAEELLYALPCMTEMKEDWLTGLAYGSITRW